MNNKLKEVNLRGRYIDLDDLQKLCEILKLNTSLESLSLESNAIHDVGAKYVSDFLKINNTLKTLILTSNCITYDGIKLIADSLIHNTCLDKLLLSSNNLKNEGAIYIMDLITQNNSITELDISYNFIDELGLKTIMNILKTNTSLKSFRMNTSSNLYSDNILSECVSDMLRQNNTLNKLGIYTSFGAPRPILSIEDALIINPSITYILYDNKPITIIEEICSRNMHNLRLKEMMLVDLP
jgi:hypothetical protein